MTNLVYEVGSMLVHRILNPDLLSKPVKIHVCKDRTLSVVLPGGKPFNGVALPVYSVDTEQEARQLIMLAGKHQYDQHPLLPDQPWMKIEIEPFVRHLELSDLPAVQEKLRHLHFIMQNQNRSAE